MLHVCRIQLAIYKAHHFEDNEVTLKTNSTFLYKK